MDYLKTISREFLNIDEIISINYLKYSNYFSLPLNTKDFWTLIYVNNGELFETKTKRKLSKDTSIFIEPYSEYSLSSSLANFLLISFKVNNSQIEFLKDKIFLSLAKEQELLSNIIFETTKKEDLAFSFHLVKIYLEQFLIYNIRNSLETSSNFTYNKFSNSDYDCFNKVKLYMENNIYSKLSMNQICKDNLISKSKLQSIFTKEVSMGIIDYFSTLKVEKAKSLIKTGKYSFSQIAEILSYSSIHYFSRQFKKISKMTPSVYANKLKNKN